MTPQTPWWTKKPFMTRGPYSDFYHHDKIVAEATRRGIEKGKREALEETRELLMGADKIWNKPSYRLACQNTVIWLERKLSSLSQSSNEKV